MKRILGVAGLACSMAVLMWAPAASAGTIICNDATGARSATDLRRHRRAEGGRCRLAGAQLTGNITAQIGASVGISTASTVSGNYTCNRCRFADLLDSSIAGNFSISGEREGQLHRWQPDQGRPPDHDEQRWAGELQHRLEHHLGQPVVQQQHGPVFAHGQHDRRESRVPEQHACSREQRQHGQEHEGAVRALTFA